MDASLRRSRLPCTRRDQKMGGPVVTDAEQGRDAFAGKPIDRHLLLATKPVSPAREPSTDGEPVVTSVAADREIARATDLPRRIRYGPVSSLPGFQSLNRPHAESGSGCAPGRRAIRS